MLEPEAVPGALATGWEIGTGSVRSPGPTSACWVELWEEAGPGLCPLVIWSLWLCRRRPCPRVGTGGEPGPRPEQAPTDQPPLVPKALYKLSGGKPAKAETLGPGWRVGVLGHGGEHLWPARRKCPVLRVQAEQQRVQGRAGSRSPTRGSEGPPELGVQTAEAPLGGGLSEDGLRAYMLIQGGFVAF